MSKIINIKTLLPVFCMLLMMAACKKETKPPVTPITPAQTFDINSINDNYADVAPFADYLEWGSHNVHDPTTIKEGDYY